MAVTYRTMMRDPRRLACAICGAWLALSAFLAWATADRIASQVSYPPISDGAEGVLLVVFGVLLVVWSLNPAVAESQSRTVQLAGPALAVGLVAVAISTESAARNQMALWHQSGWTNIFETPLAGISLAVSLLAVVLTIWIDARRPASVRDRTTGFTTEWHITRAAVVLWTGGGLGAVIGAALGLAIGVAITNGWAYAALLFILLCALGIAIGARLGTALGRLLVRTFHVG